MFDQNAAKIAAELRELTDQQLAQVLQSGSVPAYLVMAEMDGRKKMRSAGQQTPPGTVRDELQDQAGIAKFAEGGPVEWDETTRDQFLPEIFRLPREAFRGIGRAMRDGLSVEDYYGGWDRRQRALAEQRGQKPVAGIAMSRDEQRSGEIASTNATAVPPAELVGQQPDPYAPMGGLSAVMKAAYGGGGASTIPVTEVGDMQSYMDQAGAPVLAKPVTDAENLARQQAYLKANGYDFSGERKAQDERRAGLAQAKKTLPYEALLRLGLGLMTSKNTGFLGALGDAGTGAVDYLAKAKAAERAELDAIRRGDMDLARAAYAEKMQALQYAQAANRDDRAVETGNSRAVADQRRTAGLLRQGDIAQRRDDLRFNAAANAAAAAERRAGLRALLGAQGGGGGKDQYSVPGYANDTAKDIYKNAAEQLSGELQSLQSKKSRTRDENDRLQTLSRPGAIQNMAVQAQREYMGQFSLPVGPMNRRTGIGLGGAASNAIDLSQ